MNLCAKSIELLSAISVSGIVTVADMEKMMPGIPEMRKAIDGLHRQGFLMIDYVPNKPNLIQITRKGRSVLAAVNGGRGVFPMPRTSPPAQTYTGEKRTHFRPGSEDFLAAKSRRGDGYVAYRAPMLIAGKGGE